MNSAPPRATVVIPTFGNDSGAVLTSEAILSQARPEAWSIEIVVVQDGFEPGQPCRLSEDLSPEVRLVRLPRNMGRAAARNAGAGAAAGEILMFVDSDCRPSRNDWLPRMLQAFLDGDVVAAGGSVRGGYAGFWGRYQADVACRRALRHSRSEPALTTANLAVRRKAFDQCGGFDERYRHYGFEDRDLLLRLAAIGKLVAMADVVVSHDALLRLQDVARKMHEAGATTSTLFSADHPDAYRRLGYASLDCTVHPWLRPVARFLGPPAMASARGLDRWLERMPYPLAKSVVKATCALAFLYGTSRRKIPS